MDVTGKGEIQSIDNHGFWDNSGISIVREGVDLVVSGKGVSGSEFGTWENLPNDIEVV